MMLRITIVTQWYPPEQAPFGRMMHELATTLARTGWEVSVITGFPNHPAGAVFDGFKKSWLKRRTIDGVNICRVWLATSPRRTFLARIATFVSFTLTSSWRLLRQPSPDVVFAVLQPLSVGLVLPAICRLKGTRLVLNLQDLHPDAQIRLGMVRNPALIRLLRWIESYAYRHCAAVTGICESFRRHAIARGAAADRVHVVENWVDTNRLSPAPEAARTFRHEIGLEPDRFVVLWAGTLGHVSGAVVLIEAAALLRDQPRIHFLIAGEGPLVPALKARIAELALTNVTLLPFQPESKLAAMQSAGNVSLVTLAPDFAEVSVPSKVLAYLSAGRPVLASVPESSETAALIRQSGAGQVVPAGDARALANAIVALSNDEATVARLGRAARAHAVDNLSAEAATRRYDRLFRRLCGPA